MKTKTYNLKKQAKWKGLFGIILLLVGICLELIGQGNLKIGQLYINQVIFMAAIISILLSIKNYFWGKEIKYDERTQLIILKASRKTFGALIYGLIIFMTVGLIHPIQIDLNLITTIVLLFLIIVYKVYYLMIDKKY